MSYWGGTDLLTFDPGQQNLFDEAGLHWLGQLHTHHLGDGEEGGALLTDMSTGAQSVSVISLQPDSPHRLSTVLTRVTMVTRVIRMAFHGIPLTLHDIRLYLSRTFRILE